MTRAAPRSIDSSARRARAKESAAPSDATLVAVWRCGAGARLTVRATQGAEAPSGATPFAATIVDVVCEWSGRGDAPRRMQVDGTATPGAARVLRIDGAGCLACLAPTNGRNSDRSAGHAVEWHIEFELGSPTAHGDGRATATLDVVELPSAGDGSDAQRLILLTDLPSVLGLQGGTYVLEELSVSRGRSAAPERAVAGRSDRHNPESRVSDRGADPHANRQRGPGTAERRGRTGS